MSKSLEFRIKYPPPIVESHHLPADVKTEVYKNGELVALFVDPADAVDFVNVLLGASLEDTYVRKDGGLTEYYFLTDER